MSTAGNTTGRKIAVIAGGGPAGLTAALELLRRTDVTPLVFEASDGVGGISRTHVYKGNRIDIGGHRFFSKSDRVMDWWRDILPLQGMTGGDKALEITYQRKTSLIEIDENGPNPDETDDVMLVRPRKSRILYRGKLFEYPLSLSPETLMKLGLVDTAKIGTSYLQANMFPRKEETLEDFIINRFGRTLYETFFKEYTEKVWGVPCDRISAEWGAQRIKGVSLRAALQQALGKVAGFLRPQSVETSLIEQFLYPKHGPGQMWETVQGMIEARGGTVALNTRVVGLKTENGKVVSATVEGPDGKREEVACEYFFSTMPVKELFAIMDPPAPKDVADIAGGLSYRDFMTVGLLLDRLELGDCDGTNLFERMSDNWIYVQEPGVRVGRLQFFNNWSPYLVADPTKVWMGLEYFCDEGDDLWSMDDEAMIRFGVEELERIGVVRSQDVIDGTVLRVPKTYPAYWGAYDHFDKVQAHADAIDNLYLLGRNGMHRYNNQDHSMLTAMVAVDAIASGEPVKANVWDVNAEQEYHEEKSAA
ncbi:hypothetical protein DDZ18_11125 [Marinicauda salina]|uniref:Amine oxidase domain-containing protein n=1 Tax=Marinicauda salina TaxID=2135793 RepID=A0A2U2BRV7_9PROT|nr:NAD(P)/FAD-dependent oxidoreductase [Marinicauda salina]PWE16747.1 hypothetical protein DDZ18_11125 [Marinicauda salina]